MAGEGTPRYFTLEDANLALDVIRPLIAQIMDIRRRILDKQPEVWPALEKAVGNGGSQAASAIVEEFQQLEACVRAVHSTGAILKDVNTGLVDFLALRDRREVYLCWKYGEQSIQYWHELDTGFTGRKPI